MYVKPELFDANPENKTSDQLKLEQERKWKEYRSKTLGKTNVPYSSQFGINMTGKNKAIHFTQGVRVYLFTWYM